MILFQKKGLWESEKIKQLPIDQIAPSKNQPRTVFSPDSLQSLADSIAQLGILQPLTVRRVEDGWQLVAGERRLRAATLAGLTHVPCLVVRTDSQTASLLTMIENLQRQDLNFLEEARGLQHIIDQYHLSQQQLADKLGQSQSAIANKLRLLKLPQEILTALSEGGYTQRHARALLRLTNQKQLESATHTIIMEHLTVAQTEQLVDCLLTPPPVQPTLQKNSKQKIRFVPKDIRIFLNTVQRSLKLMQCAGLDAQCLQQEEDSAYIVTIRIPKPIS